MLQAALRQIALDHLSEALDGKVGVKVKGLLLGLPGRLRGGRARLGAGRRFGRGDGLFLGVRREVFGIVHGDAGDLADHLFGVRHPDRRHRQQEGPGRIDNAGIAVKGLPPADYMRDLAASPIQAEGVVGIGLLQAVDHPVVFFAVVPKRAQRADQKARGELVGSEICVRKRFHVHAAVFRDRGAILPVVVGHAVAQRVRGVVVGTDQRLADRPLQHIGADLVLPREEALPDPVGVEHAQRQAVGIGAVHILVRAPVPFHAALHILPADQDPAVLQAALGQIALEGLPEAFGGKIGVKRALGGGRSRHIQAGAGGRSGQRRSRQCRGQQAYQYFFDSFHVVFPVPVPPG